MTDTERFNTVLHDWVHVFMRRSMRDLAQFTRESGMSMAQFNTLMHLHHQGACGVTDIGSHLGVTSAAASQMIDRLVQQGLLERSEDPDDRRARQIRVTPAGRQVIEAGIAARRRWMEGLATALEPAEQEQIALALTLLTGAARRLEAAAENQAGPLS